MDMDGTWFMKKIIVTMILNGKLMVGYFVFSMSSKKKKKWKPFLEHTIYFTINIFSFKANGLPEGLFLAKIF